MMESKDNNGRIEVILPAVLDFSAAGELRDLLLDALARDSSSDIVLMGVGVERLSTAAAQVILAGRGACRAAARRLEMETPSAALVSAFTALGLAADLHHLTAS